MKDWYQRQLLNRHCVFQLEPSLSTLIDRADLPLRDGHFGMLDIVSYFNDKGGFQPPPNGQSTDEVNCVPHYDSGLLSISILSTHQGLQLKNRTINEWIDGPLDRKIGVIWLGEAASRITQNRVKPGIHRVIYPQEAKCRVTIWYEVCTIEQLRGLSDEKKNEQMAGGIVTFANVPESAEITVLPGEKKLDFLKRVEVSLGFSASKALPPVYKPRKHAVSYPTTD